MKPPTPQSILIVRLSAIGDVILASSLIPALSQAFPGVRLSWLTAESNAPLLRYNPRLAKLLLWPTHAVRKAWQQRELGQVLKGFLRTLRCVREERYDWVIDAQGLLKSGLWTRLARGRWRVGLGSREGSQFLVNQRVSRESDVDLIGIEHRLLLEALGHPMRQYQMDIEVPAQAEAEASALLESQGVRGPFAVFAPFTTRPQKHWFDDRWRELALRVQAERGWTSVILGGPESQAHANALCQGIPSLLSLSGSTSLIQAAGVVRRAALVVGVDTGLTHLGIALRRPTLALFGSTRPYLNPDFAQARVLYEPMTCSPCRRRPTCGGQFTCMQAHTVTRVWEAARELTGGVA